MPAAATFVKYVLPLVGLALVSQIAAAATPEPKLPGSYDGRFQSKCHERCFVSFHRLIANPEQYHGRNVSVVGYIDTRTADWRFVPSLEHFNTSFFGEEISLIIHDPKLRSTIQRLGKSRKAIIVTGIFNATFYPMPTYAGQITVSDAWEASPGLRLPPPFIPPPHQPK